MSAPFMLIDAHRVNVLSRRCRSSTALAVYNPRMTETVGLDHALNSLCLTSRSDQAAAAALIYISTFLHIELLRRPNDCPAVIPIKLQSTGHHRAHCGYPPSWPSSHRQGHAAHLSRCDRSYLIYFYPFGELIHHYEGVCESTFSFIEWTYEIQPPCRERQSDRYGLELMGQHMFLVSKILATFTVTNQGVSLRDCHKSLNECPREWCIFHLVIYIALKCH
jgi:hypothetical protein